MSAVIGELSALTEAIALRDCMTSDEEEARARPGGGRALVVGRRGDGARQGAGGGVRARIGGRARDHSNRGEGTRRLGEGISARRDAKSTRRRLDDEELREATEATTRAIAIVRAREEEDSNPHTETDAVEEPTSPRARSPSSPRAGNLRGDMERSNARLSQLTQSMRAALAEVDGVAP